MKYARLRLLIGIVAIIAAAPAFGAGSGAVVVASKIDTEGALLGNIIAVALRRNGIDVEDKIGLGPTRIVRAAILAGQIDIYPEYTGDGAIFFHAETDPAWKNAAAAYAKVKALDFADNQLVWLAPSPADNSWGIAVRGDAARARGIQSMDDFARFVRSGGHVKLACSIEFADSPAALPAFEAAYGFSLTQSQLLALAGGDTSATIRAAAENADGVNAAMAYGSDGALKALDMVFLVDDRHAQAFYQPAPVIRAIALARHPEIRAILDPVFQSLTLDALQKLNARIAVDGEEPKRVATDYLVAGGFVR